jgi:hypothetical protein
VVELFWQAATQTGRVGRLGRFDCHQHGSNEQDVITLSTFSSQMSRIIVDKVRGNISIWIKQNIMIVVGRLPRRDGAIGCSVEIDTTPQ